jgi:hypothetical protein
MSISTNWATGHTLTVDSTTSLGGAAQNYATLPPGIKWDITSTPIDPPFSEFRIELKLIMRMIQDIQTQINILQPAPELEQEWQQLRELGDQYRKLEAEFKEKQRMWTTLKKSS